MTSVLEPLPLLALCAAMVGYGNNNRSGETPPDPALVAANNAIIETARVVEIQSRGYRVGQSPDKTCALVQSVQSGRVNALVLEMAVERATGCAAVVSPGALGFLGGLTLLTSLPDIGHGNLQVET